MEVSEDQVDKVYVISFLKSHFFFVVLTMKSFPILDIPLDLILKYLSPFLSLPDFISFHRRTCKGLLVGQELSECRDFHKMWVKAIRGNKPSILCNIVRLSTIHSASNWPGPELGDVNAASWESENLHTISWAVAKDHVDLVRVLLADGRSNPARNDNFAIRWTTHPEIARLLLVDPRVNPAAGNNDAIRRACADGRHLVVEVLLSDHRVRRILLLCGLVVNLPLPHSPYFTS